MKLARHFVRTSDTTSYAMELEVVFCAAYGPELPRAAELLGGRSRKSALPKLLYLLDELKGTHS